MQKPQATSIPTFQQTVLAVAPLSDRVYGAMDTAAAKVELFFNTEKQRHDPFLAPCLMRFFGKRALRDQGIQAEEDGDASDFEGLPNNGLAFFYKGHHVRILKAAIVRGSPWKLPGCGESNPKTDFYDQQLEFYQDGKGGMRSSLLNIVYLWDFDQSFKLAGIHLACPKAAGAQAKDVIAHWCEALSHPAFSEHKDKTSTTNGSKSDEVLEELLREHGEDDKEEDDKATKKA